MQFSQKTIVLKSSNSYLKYSAIGLQLLVFVFVITYLGYWLDGYFETNKPIFSILFGLLSVVLGIYNLTSQLLKK
jgi:ATP synthase protein I